jgi:hypothetical protein
MKKTAKPMLSVNHAGAKKKPKPAPKPPVKGSTRIPK